MGVEVFGRVVDEWSRGSNTSVFESLLLQPFQGHQFGVVAFFDDFAGVHHEDAVGVFDGGEAVGS